MIGVEGQGLHTGKPCRVQFLPMPMMAETAPLIIRQGDHEARVNELRVDGTARSTSVQSKDGRIHVGTVEHLFAALGALSIYENLVVVIDGPEIPLADGGARQFISKLQELGEQPTSSSSQLRVIRDGTVRVGASSYDFAVVPPRDSRSRRVDVDVDFNDARLARTASWAGDPEDFTARIASARTFGFAREVEELLARGLANHVNRESVVVIADDHVMSAGAPFLSDEPARHKLLDLVGDLYAHGGPPIGHVHASRPGHAATHEAMRRAFDEGLVALQSGAAAVT